jgi:hypothetical protein
MIGLFVLGLIGLIIYNIIDTQSLINNVRCIFLMIFSLCAVSAMSAYTYREIKPLTIALVSCIVCVVCFFALTF